MDCSSHLFVVPKIMVPFEKIENNQFWHVKIDYQFIWDFRYLDSATFCMEKFRQRH